MNFRDDWPTELANVSQLVYFVSILFEFVCLIFILIIIVNAMMRYKERRKTAAKLIILVYFAFAGAIFLTIAAKSVVLFLGQPFVVGGAIEKFALLFIFFALLSLLYFDLEIFTELNSKTKNSIIGVLGAFFIIFFIDAIKDLYGPSSEFVIILYMVYALLIFSVHIYYSYKMFRKNTASLERVGMLFIFLQGIFSLLYLFANLFSVLFILMNILKPFNFLYFLSWIAVVLSLFFSYSGFFLPKWLQNLILNRTRSNS